MGVDQLPSQQDSEVPKNDECKVFGMQTFEKRLHSEDFAFDYRHSNTIEREINLSQSQNIIFQNNDSEDEEDVISTDTNRDCFTIFKRAQSLSECDKTKQAELYNLLNNFVKRHEFDHNDNDKVFSNRKKDELTTISSNRVIHTNKRGPKMKRFKAAYERK